MADRLQLVPITIKDANTLVKRWHRHHRPVHKARFAVACAVEGSDAPCGTAIIGDPCARNNDDGWTAEVLRVATDGTSNACSKVLGAAWRACRSLGYRRLITYTLPEEGGASLRGAGYVCVGRTKGGQWSRRERPRVDDHPTQPKLIWARAL